MSQTQSGRACRARYESLRADQTAAGMFDVHNRSSGSTHTVEVREPSCTCEDYTYNVGPVDGRCKHILFVQLIAAGELCAHCGYALCRPSCPERGEQR